MKLKILVNLSSKFSEESVRVGGFCLGASKYVSGNSSLRSVEQPSKQTLALTVWLTFQYFCSVGELLRPAVTELSGYVKCLSVSLVSLSSVMRVWWSGGCLLVVVGGCGGRRVSKLQTKLSQ